MSYLGRSYCTPWQTFLALLLFSIAPSIKRGGGDSPGEGKEREGKKGGGLPRKNRGRGKEKRKKGKKGGERGIVRSTFQSCSACSSLRTTDQHTDSRKVQEKEGKEGGYTT